MPVLKSYGKVAHFRYYRSEQGLSAVQEAPRAEIVRRKSDLDRRVEGAQGGKVDKMLRVLVCAVEGGNGDFSRCAGRHGTAVSD